MVDTVVARQVRRHAPKQDSSDESEPDYDFPERDVGRTTIIGNNLKEDQQDIVVPDDVPTLTEAEDEQEVETSRQMQVDAVRELDSDGCDLDWSTYCPWYVRGRKNECPGKELCVLDKVCNFIWRQSGEGDVKWYEHLKVSLLSC